MIKSIIGNDTTLDIHGGGNDLIFPHHENEIAQGSCCSSSDYCNFWFHNGIVLVDRKKMSKSLGNVILVSDILNELNPVIVRIALMSTHYRQPLNWTKDTINNSKNIFDKIHSSINHDTNDDEHRDIDFIKLLCDDLNTPNAIQYILKQAKDVKKDKSLLPKLKYNCNLIGIKSNGLRLDKLTTDKVELLVKQREIARKNKDFNQADQIRDQLYKMNVVLEDTSDGVKWKIKH